MSDKLKTIHFDNFKLDVTEEQFENIGYEVDIEYDEEEKIHKVDNPVIDIGEYIDEVLIWVIEGSIWNQPDYFENGDGTYYEFEFSKPTEGNSNLEIFDFFNEMKFGCLFLKDNSTGKFLKPSEFPKFDSMDDFNGFNEMKWDEIYLLKDFDIKSHLDI